MLKTIRIGAVLMQDTILRFPFTIRGLVCGASLLKTKSVPLYATKAVGWNGSIAPTHSRPRN
jgi:hypothetical protein